MLKSTYTYIALGGIILIIGLYNGGVDFTETFPNATNFGLLPKEVAFWFVIVGSFMFYVSIALPIAYVTSALTGALTASIIAPLLAALIMNKQKI